MRGGGSWKRSHGHGYTGTKGETPDTDKPGPDGPPRQFPTLHTLRAAHFELGGVDLDLAVEDDVLPLDRADMTQQVGVEREVRRGGKP